ncbi:MAG: NHLP leader peptide family natural product precursor [Candidatus Tectomicrobia bacterium]|uniref:NHLP leader peptide family natural product n=1 Tax=Tectimicrobiota bacterium TaxID=2528274 RepID=A0A933GMS1_UNCTE|nr:NHLP leader peptide family natural product precursor [Candidatus Tectomicrobia bacterium]
MGKKMSQIVVKAWANPAFKQKLRTEPALTLKGEGVDAPEGMELRVVENTDNICHLVLPAKPHTNAQLSEEMLEKIAAGLRKLVGMCDDRACNDVFVSLQLLT